MNIHIYNNNKGIVNSNKSTNQTLQIINNMYMEKKKKKKKKHKYIHIYIYTYTHIHIYTLAP